MAYPNTVQSGHDTYNKKARIMSEENKVEWITLADAAAIMDMHVESVRRLCRKDTSDFRCRQLFKGAPWEVAKEDAENYVKVTHKNE